MASSAAAAAAALPRNIVGDAGGGDADTAAAAAAHEYLLVEFALTILHGCDLLSPTTLVDSFVCRHSLSVKSIACVDLSAWRSAIVCILTKLAIHIQDPCAWSVDNPSAWISVVPGDVRLRRLPLPQRTQARHAW